MQMNERARANAQRGETFRLSGAYDEAIEIFKQLLEKAPNDAWVNAHLGATYCQLMDYGKAEECLKKAIGKSKNYFWAHAQLGETYRLWALAENRRKKYIDSAIEHFQKALDGKEPADSTYEWALAHLGATYRLNITSGIIQLLNELVTPALSQGKLSGLDVIQQNKDTALQYLNRALELMPTYAWAWGMRSTVYRLAQEYKDSFCDLEVETVVAPNFEILQNSSFPVPFLESSRVNLYEHAFLFFYLTKQTEDPHEKQKCYLRAIAFLQQALILRPGDLIAKLILTIVDTKQKQEKQDGQALTPDEIEKLQRKLDRFFEDLEEDFWQICKKVLRNQMNVPEPSVTIEKLQSIYNQAEEGHKLKKLILEDVINNQKSGVRENSQLWLWKNVAQIQMCTYVLFLLSELSHILGKDSNIGTARPYRELALTIAPYVFIERLYQTPVFSDADRKSIVKELNDGIGFNLKETALPKWGD
ncbi:MULTISPECIES: tetratricopeptide repeat protein [unclassified Microcoleus]|uniref:tetratricopeptide repeat protein n=2 Tax=unclassified Microcoleus TaxID=2642155 RepID=UPI001D4DC7AF|nr:MULTISPECIES: tetratricopeptide repeat protein [unclassified Microcoleus]MCC3442022.1 tetratricopeptide repeat protein [Microcoleus sp. PH2017_03_ELD_O_A]MCC3503549.1 tetratricopeptide repeat protein [Microcoleus sp. PH2017_19_SFW_U_A]MCC3521623.1 tetratricopeptide repeat protein [Microcoleus sp. PH2017_20_SFW_D_A]MCC3547310.1 tetratricopeptide repeat protein [Microcoleus sp. PH2017_24_DOB_U_A]MCC3553134.1 tetratricopeptide repeat protein [Microcoleus sp. PH2017_35_SFW_U_B]MCC3565071.1 tet